VGAFPFDIPSRTYYGSDRFVFEFSQPGWEYVVLICAPVALDDPYSQGATAFDLLYPFGLLKDQVAGGAGQPAGGISAQAAAGDTGKGFGSGALAAPATDSAAEVIAPGKKLTVFWQKYWLKQ
jgi:hypothetical protein